MQVTSAQIGEILLEAKFENVAFLGRLTEFDPSGTRSPYFESILLLVLPLSIQTMIFSIDFK